VLLISEVCFLVGAYIAAAYIEFAGDPYPYLALNSGWVNVTVVVISIVLGLYLHDLYSNICIKSTVALMQQLCFILGSAFLIQAAVSYLHHGLRMPLHVFLPGSAMAIIVMFSWRVLFSRYAFDRVGGDRL